MLPVEAEIYVRTSSIKNSSNKRQVQLRGWIFSYLAVAAAQNASFPGSHRLLQGALQQEKPQRDQEEITVRARM